MLTACSTCSKTIHNSEDNVVQGVFCEKSIHHACSTLKPSEIKLIEKCENIKCHWNTCLSQNVNSKFDILLSLTNSCIQEIITLKYQINAKNEFIKHTISKTLSETRKCRLPLHLLLPPYADSAIKCTVAAHTNTAETPNATISDKKKNSQTY